MKKIALITIMITAAVAALILVLVLALKNDRDAETPAPLPTATEEPVSTPTGLPPAYFTPTPTADPVGKVFPVKYDWLNRSRIDLMTEYQDMDIYDRTGLDAYLYSFNNNGPAMQPFFCGPLDDGEQGEINPAVYDVLGILPPAMSGPEFEITGMTSVKSLYLVFRSIVDAENLNTESVYINYPANSYAAQGINKYGIAFVCTDSSEITAQNILAGLKSLTMDYRDELRIDIVRGMYSINYETREKFVEDDEGVLFRHQLPLDEWIPRCSMDTVEEAIAHGFIIDLGSYNDLIETDAAAVVLFSGQYQDFVDKYDELNPDADRNYIKEKLDEEIKYYCSLLGVERDYFTAYLPLYWEMKGYDFEIEDLNDTISSDFLANPYVRVP